jgi:hypothetical protein
MTTYINYDDLMEVMDMYYRGTLDNTDLYISRINLQLHELHPDNTLFGQLEIEDIDICLSKLSEYQQWCLYYKFTGSVTAYEYISSYWFNDVSGSFENWFSETINIAEEQLAKHIKKRLSQTTYI